MACTHTREASSFVSFVDRSTVDGLRPQQEATSDDRAGSRTFAVMRRQYDPESCVCEDPWLDGLASRLEKKPAAGGRLINVARHAPTALTPNLNASLASMKRRHCIHRLEVCQAKKCSSLVRYLKAHIVAYFAQSMDS